MTDRIVAAFQGLLNSIVDAAPTVVVGLILLTCQRNADRAIAIVLPSAHFHDGWLAVMKFRGKFHRTIPKKAQR